MDQWISDYFAIKKMPGSTKPLVINDRTNIGKVRRIEKQPEAPWSENFTEIGEKVECDAATDSQAKTRPVG